MTITIDDDTEALYGNLDFDSSSVTVQAGSSSNSDHEHLTEASTVEIMPSTSHASPIEVITSTSQSRESGYIHNHEALQLIAIARFERGHSFEYLITLASHPFSPTYIYPSVLPIFQRRGGCTIIEVIAAGLGSLVSVGDVRALDRNLPVTTLWHNIAAKSPSKSSAALNYLVDMIKYVIAHLVDLNVSTGVSVWQLRELARELMTNQYRICLLTGGESVLSTGCRSCDLTVSTQYSGKNRYGEAVQQGIGLGLRGHIPTRPSSQTRIVIFGDASAEAFRSLINPATTSIVSMPSATIADVIFWVLDGYVPESSEVRIVLVGASEVRAGMNYTQFFRRMFDLLRLIQQRYGSYGLIVGYLAPEPRDRQVMDNIDNINSDLEHFYDQGLCTLSRFPSEIRRRPVKHWYRNFRFGLPLHVAVVQWWLELQRIFREFLIDDQMDETMPDDRDDDIGPDGQD